MLHHLPLQYAVVRYSPSLTFFGRFVGADGHGEVELLQNLPHPRFIRLVPHGSDTVQNARFVETLVEKRDEGLAWSAITCQAVAEEVVEDLRVDARLDERLCWGVRMDVWYVGSLGHKIGKIEQPNTDWLYGSRFAV
jgi:hypothetical protein